MDLDYTTDDPRRTPQDRKGRTRNKAEVWRKWEPASWAARHNAAFNNAKDGTIYVLGAGRQFQQVKVGKTTRDPYRRCTELQTGSPVPIRVLASFETSYLANAEMLIHAALEPWHQKGEWFLADSALVVAAWRHVRRVWPRRPSSPQAWADAHKACRDWGRARLDRNPRPETVLPPGVHVPPFGAPVTVPQRRHNGKPSKGKKGKRGGAHGQRKRPPKKVRRAAVGTAPTEIVRSSGRQPTRTQILEAEVRAELKRRRKAARKAARKKAGMADLNRRV